MSEQGIYVYGLVSAGALDAAPDVPGIDPAHPIECVASGAVCALVSRVELEQFDEDSLHANLQDMAWVEHTARSHQRVLDAVLERTTPIPMRLCTVYHDEQGLRDMLDRDQEELAAALNDLGGKLEWGVQAFAPTRSISNSQQPAAVTAATTTGTAYLQNRLAALDTGEQRQANLERACDHLHAELCAAALACRLGVPHRPEVTGHDAPMMLNAFYLVPNDQRMTFEARFAELHQELEPKGIELLLTGPWAPYNFVTASVGEAR